MKTVIAVEGMHCQGCADAIALGLKKRDGVTNANASFEKKSAEVEFDLSKVKLEELKNEIRKLGYKA